MLRLDGKFSEERCVCVRARGSLGKPGAGSVLLLPPPGRFCLGFVSVLPRGRFGGVLGPFGVVLGGFGGLGGVIWDRGARKG